MRSICLFADSNLLLHYKSLEQIDWSRLGDFDNIEVVVCRTVQREIDALKDGRSGRRSDRARKAARTLLKIAQHGPQVRREASPRVVLKLYGASQPKQDLADQLDYSQNDDRIMGYLAQFIADNPSIDARLLTRDSGPVLTAKALCIPYVVVPDDWRLEPEPDDRDRKIQKLELQLQELQDQEPQFQFSCSQQSDTRARHVEIEYKAFRPLEEAERVQLLHHLQNQYPPTVVERNGISAKAIFEYEERDYPTWKSQCREFFDLVNCIVQMEHCPELKVSIQNNGSRPATNVLVEIRSSGNFGLSAPVSELREFGLIPVIERPRPPNQPRRQASWASIVNNLTRSSATVLPDLDLAQSFRDLEDFEYATDVKLETELSIRLTCGLWRHSLEPKGFTIRLVPATIDSPTTGEITCTVHADNLSKPATFNRVVTLSPDYQPTLEPALRWFTTPHPNEVG